MRILLFIDSLGAGGAQRQIVGLAKLLEERGHHIVVLTYYDIPFYQPQLDACGIACEHVKDGGNYLRRVWKVRKYIRSYSPDWVVAYLDSPSVIAAFWRGLGMNYRLMVSERNTTQRLTWRERIKFFLYRYADVIVSNSFAQKLFVDSHYPQYQQKSTVIPNFVDLQQFSPADGKQRGNVILVVATVCKSKNTLGFIEAVREVKASGQSFMVKWFGVTESTPYIEACRERIAASHLENEFLLLHKTTDIAMEYRRADFFCLPSFHEGTPNALCEALASGLPVICSDISDNGVYVKDDVNGFLFNPHDPSDIADRIGKALLLPDDVYRSYSKASRMVAEIYFSTWRFVEAYQELLKTNL